MAQNKHWSQYVLAIVIVLAILGTILFFVSKFEDTESPEYIDVEYHSVRDMGERELAKFREEKVDSCVKKNIEYPEDYALATLDENNCKGADDEKDCIQVVKGFKTILNSESCSRVDQADVQLCNAIKSQGISVCDSLTDGEDILCKAAITKDTNQCDTLSDEDEKLACKSAVTGDTSYFINPIKEECRKYVNIDIATYRGEEPDCSGINDQAVKQMCNKNLYLSQIPNPTSEKCSAMQDTDIQKACLSVLNQDPALCESVSDIEAQKLCSTQLVLNLNTGVCGNFTNSEIKESCLSFYNS